MTLAILDRWGRPIPEAPAPPEVKAITGPGAVALTYGTPLGSAGAYRRTPQQRAYNAIVLYQENDYINEAETAVSDRGGSVEWHLEDDNEEEVTDDSAPNYLAVRDLMENPQAALPWDQRQPGCETSRGLWTLLLREMGLCGMSAIHLDQTDALAGTPLALLHLSPWRMYTVLNPDGRLLGWTLDHPMDEGGIPLEIKNLLLFYLSPPSMGYYGTGKVDAIWRKAALSTAITNHLLGVIGAGGRLTGLLSPKEGSVVSDDNWTKFINDYRNITSDPNAAQRLQIVRGPVDYTRTAATPDELGLIATDERTQKSILALWGVPESQIGSAPPAGLNSGSTKGFDEAILWQGAIHPRLQSLYETFQRGLLDRYKALGTTVELVIEEPEFDDDTPLFAKAQMAANIPLTNDERRELTGYEPFDEAGPNAELGPQVWVPISLTAITPSAVPEPAPVVKVLPPNAPPQLGPGVQPPPDEQPSKATLTRFEALRRKVDESVVPKVKSAVHAVLQDQKRSVIAYLEKAGLEHLKRKMDFRWDAKAANRELENALKPHLGQIAGKVAVKTHAALGDLQPAKATATDEFADKVTTRVLTKGAGRVAGINETTRTALQATIAEALKDADTINDIINAVDAMPQWGVDRAELIARTESMFAYNDAALGSYKELGVEMVEAIDGDEDAECIDRLARNPYTLEDAEAEEDHPNGTLDWSPIIPDEGKAVVEWADNVKVWATGVLSIPTPEKPIERRVRIEYDDLGRVTGWVRS